MVGDHVVKEQSDHDEIRLREYDFNIFDEDEEGVVRKGYSEPYLIFLLSYGLGIG